MIRGRKPASYDLPLNWESIFWNSLPTYIGILNNYFVSVGFDLVDIGSCIDKLSFTVPKGLHSKQIKSLGKYPVISQSKEYTIGFSDEEELLVKNNLPLIVFGDHSKTIKFVDAPFIIGADGVKLIKPKSNFNERYFYFFLFGVITDTKDYGRHYGLLRKGTIAKIEDIHLQESVTAFLDALKKPSFLGEQIFFNEKIEKQISKLQSNQLKSASISTELTHQLTLVKKLRQQLLQDAVQGKLVKQNPADEPASELLKKIKAEKEKLVAEKKIKKEKEFPSIKAEEIPFDIPDNWVWCRLGAAITQIFDGPFGSHLKSVDYTTSGIQVIRLQNLGVMKFKNEKETFVNQEKYKSIIQHTVYEGDIIIGSFLADGVNCVVLPKLKHTAIAKADCFTIRIKHQMLLKKYIMFLLSSDIMFIELSKLLRGMTRLRINTTQLKQVLIPLPPLPEQNRIVEKLDELMQHCNDLEASIKQSQMQNEQLLQQVLKEALQSK